MRVKAIEITIPELEDSPPTRRMWTEREESVLRKYYGRTDTRKIADYLGRSTDAVHGKAQNLGLVYSGVYKNE